MSTIEKSLASLEANVRAKNTASVKANTKREAKNNANDVHLTKPDSRIATQSRILIEASYNMSVPAKRVFLMLLGEIHPAQKNVLGKVRIDAIDYAKKTGLDQSQSYSDLKKGARELMRTIITTQDKKARTIEECVVLQGMKYHTDQGWLEAQFSSFITPYIHKLVKGYTSIEIEEAVKFKRFHTIRFYELLMQFKRTQERFITVKELRRIMQVKDGTYTRFVDFKRRVIEPCVKEIVEKTSWDIEYETIRTGRTVTSLSIMFERNSQRNLDF